MALLADWWSTAAGSLVVAAAAIALWHLVREPDTATGASAGAIVRSSAGPTLLLGTGLFVFAVLASLSASLLAVYFVIWWTVLFAVLPFGARSQAETGDIVPGTEPAAPGRPLLLRKAIATSLISIVIFLVFYWLRFHSGYALADLPFLPELHY